MKSEDISLHAGGLKRCVGGLGFFFPFCCLILFYFPIIINQHHCRPTIMIEIVEESSVLVLSAQELFLGCSLPFPAQQEWNCLTLPQLLIQRWVEVARSAWITSIYPRPIWPCTPRSCHLYRPSIATGAFLQ